MPSEAAFLLDDRQKGLWLCDHTKDSEKKCLKAFLDPIVRRHHKVLSREGRRLEFEMN